MLNQSPFSPQKCELFCNYIGVRIFNFSQIIKIIKNSHYVVLHVSFFLSYAIISWLGNYLYYMKCWFPQCILMNVFMNRIPWNRKLKQLCQLDYVKFVVCSRNFKWPVLWEFSYIVNVGLFAGIVMEMSWWSVLWNEIIKITAEVTYVNVTPRASCSLLFKEQRITYVTFWISSKHDFSIQTFLQNVSIFQN